MKIDDISFKNEALYDEIEALNIGHKTVMDRRNAKITEQKEKLMRVQVLEAEIKQKDQIFA